MVLPDSAQRLQSRGHARRAGSEAARSPLRQLENGSPHAELVPLSPTMLVCLLSLGYNRVPSLLCFANSLTHFTSTSTPPMSGDSWRQE
jgi:hypothetical protein